FDQDTSTKFNELISITDFNKWYIGKGIAEVVSISDVSDLEVQLGFYSGKIDTVTTSDLSKIDLDKILEDTLIVNDVSEIAVSFNRPFEEDIVSSDTNRKFNISSNKTESIFINDISSLKYSKPFSDNVTLTDTISAALTIRRNLVDGVYY